MKRTSAKLITNLKNSCGRRVWVGVKTDCECKT